jgi:hypothetical protein
LADTAPAYNAAHGRRTIFGALMDPAERSA